MPQYAPVVVKGPVAVGICRNAEILDFYVIHHNIIHDRLLHNGIGLRLDRSISTLSSSTINFESETSSSINLSL